METKTCSIQWGTDSVGEQFQKQIQATMGRSNSFWLLFKRTIKRTCARSPSTRWISFYFIYFQSFSLFDSISEKKPVSPYIYTGHGESFFLSKDMYKAYKAKCRCGQHRSGIHLVHCLKKCSHSSMDKDKSITEVKLPPIPLKSSEMIGLKHNYLTWERSTYYVSPKCFVPKQAKVGYRLFNNIILGWFDYRM